MPLYLRILERFGIPSAPDAQIIIGDHRVKVRREIHVLEVPLLRRVSKLSVIPVQHAHPVGLALAQVIRQIVPDPRPQERRYPSHRWQMVLIDVVEDLVVQRYEILELGLG